MRARPAGPVTPARVRLYWAQRRVAHKNCLYFDSAAAGGVL